MFTASEYFFYYVDFYLIYFSTLLFVLTDPGSVLFDLSMGSESLFGLWFVCSASF